jgi:hypothetical protein
MYPELISHRKWPPGIEAAIPRVIQSNRFYHGITDQFNVSNGSISNVMKLFKSFGWCDAPIYNEKTPDRDPKTGLIAGLVVKNDLSIRSERGQNGSTDEKHGFSQCYRRLKKVTEC